MSLPLLPGLLPGCSQPPWLMAIALGSLSPTLTFPSGSVSSPLPPRAAWVFSCAQLGHRPISLSSGSHLGAPPGGATSVLHLDLSPSQAECTISPAQDPNGSPSPDPPSWNSAPPPLTPAHHHHHPPPTTSPPPPRLLQSCLCHHLEPSVVTPFPARQFSRLNVHPNSATTILSSCLSFLSSAP